MPFHVAQCVPAQVEVLGEAVWNKLRLVIAHDPQVAFDAGAKRDKRIDELKKQADLWVGKLQDQDEGKKKRGRKLSDGGARAKFYREVSEAHLMRIVKVDLKSELFTYDIDERALKHARLADRIHAHASICFMALILYRVMRTRLKDSNTQISPEHSRLRSRP